MRTYQYWVYIMTNEWNTVFYIGVTGDIQKRVFEHREKLIDGFSKKYRLTKLVYIEHFTNIKEAIKREKQLKNWRRAWKLDLIRKSNPLFLDLASNDDAFTDYKRDKTTI